MLVEWLPGQPPSVTGNGLSTNQIIVSWLPSTVAVLSGVISYRLFYQKITDSVYHSVCYSIFISSILCHISSLCYAAVIFIFCLFYSLFIFYLSYSVFSSIPCYSILISYLCYFIFISMYYRQHKRLTQPCCCPTSNLILPIRFIL